MAEAVLDASAVLAAMLGEPGAEEVRAALPAALLGSVNAAEVVTKLIRYGAGLAQHGGQHSGGVQYRLSHSRARAQLPCDDQLSTRRPG